jgi:hypothetical protein
MAAPITHVVLTNKVLDKFFGDKDRKLFMLGTSFPDIRRLGKIEREKVHFNDFSLVEMKNDDPFTAGLKFHSVVDEVRKKYVQDNNIISLFPDSEFIKEAVKIFEDRILRNKSDRWEETAGYFDQIYQEELIFGVKEEDVRTWHKMLTEYFLSDINKDIGITNFIMGSGNSQETVAEMVRTANEVKDYKKAEELVLNFYDNFEKLIKLAGQFL